MSKCTYHRYYYDIEEEDEIEFFCDELALTNTDFCKFHHPTYFRTYVDEINDEFQKKITKAIETNSKLLCLGYRIPFIEISGKSFEREIVLDDVVSERLIIDKCNFKFLSFQDSKINKFYIYDSKLDFCYAHKTKLNSCRISGSEFNNIAFPQCDVNDLYIYGVNFDKGDFGRCKFNEVILIKCKLNSFSFDQTEFVKANISENKLTDCYFRSAKFNVVFFKKSIFKNTRFNNSMFENTSFEETTFERVDFSFCKFEKFLNFFNTKFLDYTNFENVLFDNQERTFFSDDLSNVSFKNCDISRIHFHDNVKWGGKDQFTIIDEIEARKLPDKYSLSSILAIYRNLRENYEYRLRYQEAGSFFIKEMNLKREFKE